MANSAVGVWGKPALKQSMRGFMGVMLTFAVTMAHAAERPPNDDFTNAVALTGNEVTFSGSVAGATVEGEEYSGGASGPTVWWYWTASETTPVALEIVTPPENHETVINDNDTVINVYHTPGPGLGLPLNTGFGGTSPVSHLLCRTTPHAYKIFQATNGGTYYFQLAGKATNRMTFILRASQAPVIQEQPTSLTIASNGVALFTVAATGLPPSPWFTPPNVPLAFYQWRLNEVDIPGATNTVLLITNVTSADTGAYRVVVGNGQNSATSACANLWLSMEAVRPFLSTLPDAHDGMFRFALTGETGRCYRVESSGDLAGWIPEARFDSGSVHAPGSGPFLTSVVSANGNGVLLPALVKNAQRKYYRAELYSPSNGICNANLKMMRFGKELWARAGNRDTFELPQDRDMYITLGLSHPPRCPQGGVCAFNWYDTLPTCSVPGHLLEEPR